MSAPNSTNTNSHGPRSMVPDTRITGPWAHVSQHSQRYICTTLMYRAYPSVTISVTSSRSSFRVNTKCIEPYRRAAVSFKHIPENADEVKDIVFTLFIRLLDHGSCQWQFYIDAESDEQQSLVSSTMVNSFLEEDLDPGSQDLFASTVFGIHSNWREWLNNTTGDLVLRSDVNPNGSNEVQHEVQQAVQTPLVTAMISDTPAFRDYRDASESDEEDEISDSDSSGDETVIGDDIA